MNIEVIGQSRPGVGCRRLWERVITVTREMGLEARVELRADGERMLRLGVLQEPVLALNDVVLFSGFVPPTGSIRRKLQELCPQQQETPPRGDACNCNLEAASTHRTPDHKVGAAVLERPSQGKYAAPLQDGAKGEEYGDKA